jgi:hypothetical protein
MEAITCFWTVPGRQSPGTAKIGGDGRLACHQARISAEMQESGHSFAPLPGRLVQKAGKTPNKQRK